MKISIVTICFNNENEIRETIESVVNQKYNDIEYIIIDGGSKDKTIDIIHEFSTSISRIVSEPDKGIYDAINKGIRFATGEYVGLIHAGDRLYDEHVIEKIALHFKNNPGLESLYGNALVENSRKKIIRIDKSPKYSKTLFKYGWFLPHESFYVKTSLFDKYGYYKLNYKIAADYELVLRFLYFNHVSAGLLDEYIYYFSAGGISNKNMNSIIEQNKECVAAWGDNNSSIPFYTIILKLLRKIFLYGAAMYRNKRTI